MACGTSALSGFVDILMEMSHCKRARSRDRRRRICAYSRHIETPRHLVIELNPDGSDYLVRTDAAGTVLVSTWPAVHFVLVRATDRLTRDTILAQWPVDGDAPDRSTLQRWLNRATDQGLICRAGSGYRGDAFRFWLPGREPLLWPGDRASEAEKQAWRDRLAAHARASREQGQAP